MHTKAVNKMFIRKQLNTLKELVKENELTVDMILVPLTLNIADRLMRILQ